LVNGGSGQTERIGLRTVGSGFGDSGFCTGNSGEESLSSSEPFFGTRCAER
jgi:hypothetical protein